MPSITLAGANPLTLECPTPYSEPGASVTDACDPSPSLTISGTVDESTPGTYFVTYTATDASGNLEVANREVHVVDTAPPVITLIGAAPQLIECPLPYTELGATASDTCDQSLGPVVIDASAVDTSSPGSYIVTYDISDASGNAAATMTRIVDVVDTTPPAITLAGANPQVIECPDPYVELGASASDTCDQSLGPVVIDASAVDTSTPGSYSVTYDISDSGGNAAAQVVRTVNVVDTTPPVITLAGGDLTIECHIGTFAEPGFSASDTCEGDLTGAVVVGGDTVDASVLGTYVITYDVTDSAGNAAPQATRTVTVQDTTAPQITCPDDLVVSAQSPLGAIVTYVVTATDACTPVLVVQCTPASGSMFPIGDTLVTCTTADDAGNPASCTFTITVLSPEQMLDEAIDFVDNLPIHHGAKNALLVKLMNSLSNLMKGNTVASLNLLEAFKAHVEAQRGKKLTDAQADELIARANAIIAAIVGAAAPAPEVVLEGVDFGDRLTLEAALAGSPGNLQLVQFVTPGTDEGASHIIRLIWNGIGVLESAADLHGPWTEVSLSTSPYWHEVLPTEPRKFFRIRQSE